MVQDELRNKSTGIIHNELIMQWEDEWQLQLIVLSTCLNLLARIVYQKDNGLLIKCHNHRENSLVL